MGTPRTMRQNQDKLRIGRDGFFMIAVVAVTVFFGGAVIADGTSSSDLQAGAGSRKADWPEPTWETRKKARTFLLSVPAPRGQIVDRNGKTLAQSRIVHNLGIRFPQAHGVEEEDAVSYATERIRVAERLLGRSISIDDSRIREHYLNRGALPLIIQENLSEAEVAEVSRGIGVGLEVDSAYTRYYPHGKTACHLLGYIGRKAPLSAKPIENMDNIFPEEEGREGLELTFDNFLSGTSGVLNLTLDENGAVVAERTERAPVPGNNVVTTIDLDAQTLIEKALVESGRHGAVVLIDPANGDVLAMASNPSFDPNIFAPLVNPETFREVSENPSAPLFCRAHKGSYPPGSTFKTFVGLCGLQTGVISRETKFGCPSGMKIGNMWFSNHESSDGGEIALKDAMARSCNTWFYQLGLRLGEEAITAMANAMGFGQRTGIPLRGEGAGGLPNKDSFFKRHGRHLSQGDVANMSIGQGDVQVTPLQMARAMGIIASGGKIHQTRLVKQVQAIDNTVVAAYPSRVRGGVTLPIDNLNAIAEALVSVTSGAGGTGSRAAWTKKIKVAGKTGTAQRTLDGVKKNVAWFAGFAPANDPRYAFAIALEGRAGEDVSGGKTAAPVAKKILSNLLKDYSPPEPKGEQKGVDNNMKQESVTAAETESTGQPLISDVVAQSIENLVEGNAGTPDGSGVSVSGSGDMGGVSVSEPEPEIRAALPVDTPTVSLAEERGEDVFGAGGSGRNLEDAMAVEIVDNP
jgi:penicillin-binding protein 2